MQGSGSENKYRTLQDLLVQRTNTDLYELEGLGSENQCQILKDFKVLSRRTNTEPEGLKGIKNWKVLCRRRTNTEP